MTATMLAAVYHGPHDVRIEERPVPEAGPDEVLIRILRSGMCGTDATEWKNGPHLFPSDRPHAITGVSGPFILGHEFVGEVVEAPARSAFAAGDLVACGAGVSCGECDRCREGRTNLCVNYHTYGLNQDGGMAEFAAVTESVLMRIPDSLPLDDAGLAQPLAVGMHAARRSGAVDGDRVVVIGAGAIGTFVLVGLTSLAEVDVTVVDFAGPRLKRAMRLGATRTVAVDDGMQQRVLDALGGPADVVIEASGAPGQFETALHLVRSGGTILQVGLPARPAEVDLHSLVVREVTVRTTNAHVFAEDLGAALNLLASRRALGEELLTAVHPLHELPSQLEELASGRLEGKVLFDPALSRL
ncbi:zinc-dependent alcohol dehydrogenase [Microbacterium terrisoli]|uniref:zinc-dependent alcohol dehydrogenase n=1 Tax=Microbacterium terrisoli TaxID=3242192 RepID=UPI0028055AC5|nr:alcohol dehydrogenase catalytic domain-containing protein [Microbacterium protaetiae]